MYAVLRLSHLLSLSHLFQVPEFKWHIIEDRVPFEIGNTGIRVNPFAGMFEL